MEDPWANAWGEPSKSSIPVTTTASSSSWTAPSVSVIQGDHEDDLSAPEWSIKPATGWGDPDIAETSLWGSDVSAGWNPAPSTFDRISLTSKDSTTVVTDTSYVDAVEPASQEQGNPHMPPPSPPSAETDDEELASTPPRIQSPKPVLKSKSPSPIVPTLSLPPVDDGDGFGGFENVIEDAEDWGTPSKPTFSLPSADALAWGTEPWEAPSSAASYSQEEEEQEEDEWEAARQQKAKQDQHVPPELLAAILEQFADVSSNLWPESTLAEDSQQSPKRVDVDSLGLDSIKDRLVPEDLTLPANIPFSKTFISKQMSDALKLTRHSLITRTSPMALYMASKGSTSWEAALKAAPNIIPEDGIPAGWKILDSSKEEVVADDGKKKPSGGLLSFFGRRGTTSSIDATKRSSSPLSNSAISSKPTGSPRASVDATRRSASQSLAGSAPPSPSVASFGLNGSQKNDSKVLSDTPLTSPPVPTEVIVRDPSPPPPSAVSRFLGRFSSRPKSSSMESISLSQDDLEFLSDVPSLTSPELDNHSDLDALSLMIRSQALPTKLPAPLQPPPRAPPKSATPLPTPASQPINDDFMSFFETIDSGPQKPIQSELPLPLLTAVPTPPVKPVLSPPVASSPPPQSQIIPTVLVGTPEQQATPDQQSWPTFDYPVAAPPMSKSSQNKRTFVPIMTSSSTPSSMTPPLLPKPGSFSLPPPPSNQRGQSNFNVMSSTSSTIPTIPPPTTSRSQTPARIAQPVIIDDDDDFADFLSSPAQTTDPTPSSFPQFMATTLQTPPRPSHAKPTTSNGTYEFDDFLSPLPPQPPAKSNSFASNTANVSESHYKLPTPPPKPNGQAPALTGKVAKKADHSRTLSLMETAAARGRWLSPPSPLPEALQPPPGGKSSSNTDLFGFGGSSMQNQQANVMASLSASQSTPSIPSNSSADPPWNFSSPMKPIGLHPNSRPQITVPTAVIPQPTFVPSAPANGNAGAKSGGLSAQDLSFFEGL